jgi:hypothetical protein
MSAVITNPNQLFISVLNLIKFEWSHALNTTGVDFTAKYLITSPFPTMQS